MPNAILYEQLQQQWKTQGIAGVLETVEAELRVRQQYPELFEVLRLQIRLRLGLSVAGDQADPPLSADQQQLLDQSLTAACREVGSLMMQQGAFRAGWTYLQASGDQEIAAGFMDQISADSENLDEAIEVAIGEGVHPVKGFSLLLDREGTCQAVTVFESAIRFHPREIQQQCAQLLCEHLYREMVTSVASEVGQREDDVSPQPSLHELIKDRDGLFDHHNHHVDPSHLACTIGFARVLEDPHTIGHVLEMIEYGSRLDSQLQLEGTPPFADLYASHQLYFESLAGRRVEEAIHYFQQQAQQDNDPPFDLEAIEVYIDLLSRLGRHRQALQFALQHLPASGGRLGVAPSLVDLAELAGDVSSLLEHYQSLDDLLGFATTLTRTPRPSGD